MKLTFTYDRNRDIHCLLNYGKTSINSPTPTKVYEELISKYGEDVSESETDTFIESYFSTHKTDVNSFLKRFQEQWDAISLEYQKKAWQVFGVNLPSDVTAYLTINHRAPYSIEENMFYIVMYGSAPIKTAMHELWHFYTWYKYGIEWEKKLGTEKYNEIKEALTVLLNVECKDLLPTGVEDSGYPQHKELRERIINLWVKDQNIENLWNALVL